MFADVLACRADARDDHLAQLSFCPGHETLRILSRKWLSLIVEALADGRLGHAAIARRVPGATQKMLTQTLRQMERDGLVTRYGDAHGPPGGRLRAHRAGALAPGTPAVGPGVG